MSKSAFIPTLKIKLKNKTKPSHLITHVQPRGCRKCYWKFTLSFIQSTEHPNQAGYHIPGPVPWPESDAVLGAITSCVTSTCYACRASAFLSVEENSVYFIGKLWQSQRHYWGRHSTLLKQFLTHFLVQTLPYCNNQLAPLEQLISMPGSALKYSSIHTSNKSYL